MLIPNPNHDGVDRTPAATKPKSAGAKAKPIGQRVWMADDPANPIDPDIQCPKRPPFFSHNRVPHEHDFMNEPDFQLVDEFRLHFMAVARGFVRHFHLMAREDGTVFRRMRESMYLHDLGRLQTTIFAILQRARLADPAPGNDPSHADPTKGGGK